MVRRRLFPVRSLIYASLGFVVIASLAGCHKFGMGDPRTAPDDSQTFLGPKRPPVKNKEYLAIQDSTDSSVANPSPIDSKAMASPMPAMAATPAFADNSAFWSSGNGWSNNAPAVSMNTPSVPAPGNFAPPAAPMMPTVGASGMPAPAYNTVPMQNNSYPYAAAASPALPAPTAPYMPSAPAFPNTSAAISMPSSAPAITPMAAFPSNNYTFNQPPAKHIISPAPGATTDYYTQELSSTQSPLVGGSIGSMANNIPPTVTTPTNTNVGGATQYSMSAPVASVNSDNLPQINPYPASSAVSAAPGPAWAAPETESYQQASYTPPVSHAEQYPQATYPAADDWGSGAVYYDDGRTAGTSYGDINLTPPHYDRNGHDSFLPKSRYGGANRRY